MFPPHGVPPGNVFRKLPENVLTPSAGIIDVIALIAVGDVEQTLIDIWPEHAEFLPHTSQLGIAEQPYISRPPVQRNFTISARSITSGFQGRKGGVAALCLACLRQNDNVLAEILRNVLLEPVADICDSLTLPCIRIRRKECRLHLIAGLANTEHERTFRLLNLGKGAVRRQYNRFGTLTCFTREIPLRAVTRCVMPSSASDTPFSVVTVLMSCTSVSRTSVGTKCVSY